MCVARRVLEALQKEATESPIHPMKEKSGTETLLADCSPTATDHATQAYVRRSNQ
jgi:hypothetical protein